MTYKKLSTHPQAATLSPSVLQKENILLQLAAAYPLPLPVSTLYQGLRLAGYEVQIDTLEKHLAYLEDKGFLSTQVCVLDASEVYFRLTAQGEDVLASSKKYKLKY